MHVHISNQTCFYLNNLIHYNGDWLNGKRNGKGISYYIENNNQIEYNGIWLNDLYNGKGIKYSIEGNIIHNGEWINHVYDENITKTPSDLLSNGHKLNQYFYILIILIISVLII